MGRLFQVTGDEVCEDAGYVLFQEDVHVGRIMCNRFCGAGRVSVGVERTLRRTL